MSAVALEAPLAGLKILVVEDESMVAIWLEMMLDELGCDVVGPVARVSEALQLIETRQVQAAVLDINLADESVFPVADKLLSQGIPFIFATGYGTAGLVERHRNHSVLQKPYTQEKLQAALAEVMRENVQRN